MCSSNLVVDQNIIDPQIIKEKVTAALKVLSFREPRVLVQFWSPVAVMKRCLLTTLDQPFGLGAIDEGLYKYRLESEQRVFVVDGEHREELGPPGRVYRQKLPEWTLDMHGYINLPVFEPRSGCCVGVLELITSSKYNDYAFEVRQVSRALKEENLKSSNSAAAGTNENLVSYMNSGTEDVDIDAGGLPIKEMDYSKQPIRKKKTDKPISLEEDKPSNSAAAGTNGNVVPYLAGCRD
ncbi:hypothetical protein Hanom_Chr12g01076591 [Helianthus anomalus]